MIQWIPAAGIEVSALLFLEESVTACNRPDSTSSAFGTLEPGYSVDINVRTAGGWLGFDPGTAQAANRKLPIQVASPWICLLDH